jgi:hypothetical protein
LARRGEMSDQRTKAAVGELLNEWDREKLRRRLIRVQEALVGL